MRRFLLVQELHAVQDPLGVLGHEQLRDAALKRHPVFDYHLERLARHVLLQNVQRIVFPRYTKVRDQIPVLEGLEALNLADELGNASLTRP